MKIDRPIILVYLLLTVVLTIFDVVSDLLRGIGWEHVLIESIIILLGLVGSIFLLLKFYREMQDKVNSSRSAADDQRRHAEILEGERKKLLAGLSSQIATQLNQWQLTKSEKEISFMLIKGFSIREIAQLRSIKEKTVRQHCTSIYRKSQLSGRAELSGYFLEDLLPPI